MPPAPNTASSTVPAVFRLVITKAAASAASRAEAAIRAPRCSNAVHLPGSASKTCTEAPVSSSLAAIAEPMTPTPTTATRITHGS